MNNSNMNNAVRKIHNLLSSGAVTVTGPNQPRAFKQKVGSSTLTAGAVNNVQPQVHGGVRCYVCDETLAAGMAQHPLTEMKTSHTTTKFPNKIGQLVGEAFMVIVSSEDVVCSRCTNLINYLDRLENDVERVRTNLMNLLHKKYGLNDEGGGGGSPPSKTQKLNSGTALRTVEDALDNTRTRKLTHVNVANDTTVGKQSPPVSAVQQMKITTLPAVQQTTSGTQTLQRKTTKIYKCLTCEFKTADMRLFNTHYETCKQQNFQCKNCKKIFPNFGTMKQHMMREHNTSMENTCSVCHINFVSDTALRKHMDMNHCTNVLVTTTTTLPGGAAVAATAPMADSVSPTVMPATPIMTCPHCQFKTTDKNGFEEHMRKHMTGSKPKPFKCRLCSQRFETREAATIHAKQHQPNYFKCGTCSLSFPKRESLVKHFETHQHQASANAQQQQQQQQQQQIVVQATAAGAKQTTQQPPSQNALTTQKLLQDTIDEALSDSVSTTTTTADAANIRFFSCHLCSLTFIQDTYYNQHMETHRREKKGAAGSMVTASSSNHSNASLHSANSAGLLGDGVSSSTNKGDNGVSTSSSIQSNSNPSSNANISEADIESIFEKMHSDKGDTSAGADAVATSAANTVTTNTAAATSGAQGRDNLVITSQESSDGLTFKVSIPEMGKARSENSKLPPSTTASVNVSIDMPMLDQPEDVISANARKTLDKDGAKKDNGARKNAAPPVSMPSLDDDNELDGGQNAQSAEKTEAKHAALKAEDSADIAVKQEPEDEKNTSVSEESQPKIDEADIKQNHEEDEVTAEQLAADAGDQQVAMELDEAMQAQVESGQIKFILNENGQLLQLDNHIITDADGNQILVQDPEQIQQLLQSVVLQSGDGLDGETLQMMTDGNTQMVLVQGENNEAQLIDASLLNSEGQLVLQGQDGEMGEGAHVISEDGTRIPVSLSYTPDGQTIMQVRQMETDGGQHVVLDKDSAAVTTTSDGVSQASDAAGNATAGGFYALDDLMHPGEETKAE